MLLRRDVSNTLICRLISLREPISGDREASVTSDSLGYGKAVSVAHPDDAETVLTPFLRKDGTPGLVAPLLLVLQRKEFCVPPGTSDLAATYGEVPRAWGNAGRASPVGQAPAFQGDSRRSREFLPL